MTEETLLPEEIQEDPNNSEISDLHQVIHVQTMYENWFLDYASYVILDRAIPDVIDGLNRCRGESYTQWMNWRTEGTIKWPISLEIR